MSALLLVLIYRLAILGTCAYAVFWLDRSGWWFLLALLLIGGVSASYRRD